MSVSSASPRVHQISIATKRRDGEMTLVHNTIAPRHQQGTIVGQPSHRPSKHHDAASKEWMKSVDGEIKLLRNENEHVRSENEQIRHENKMLHNKVETLEDNVKILFLLNEKGAPSTVSGVLSTNVNVNANGTSCEADGANIVAETTPKQTNKKKKQKKKRKGSKMTRYFGVGGSVAKIVGGKLMAKLTVGLLSVALLIFLSIGQGVMIWGTPSPFPSDKSAQDIAREKFKEMVHAAKLRGKKEVPPAEDQSFVSKSEDKDDFWSRILQEISLFDETTANPTTSTIPSTGPTFRATMRTSHSPNIAPSKERTDESTDLGTWALTTLSKFAYPPGFVCDMDINECGCPDVFQADYRGSISTTVTGFQCENWPVEWIQNDWFPEAGLEENFCRSPPDFAILGPWCFSTNPNKDDEPCDIPICGASPTAAPTTAMPTSSLKPTKSSSPSAIPTSSQSPTQMCQVADKETCGCQAQFKADYRGSISATVDGIECERWDAEWINHYWKAKTYGVVDGLFNFLPNAGLEDNFCRNPGFQDQQAGDPTRPGCYIQLLAEEGPEFRYCDIPECNPCSCMPPCGEPNPEICGCPNALQSETCCEEDDSSCKCAYLKHACRKSLENGITDFCDIAEAECCRSKHDPNCACNMFEQICSEGPSEPTCDFAAEICCESILGLNQDICLCDFYSYAETSMIYEGESKLDNCTNTFENNAVSSPLLEKYFLESLYKAGGGMYWFNSTGWSEEDVDQCDWYGVRCDGGFVTEINLRNNNLTGLAYVRFPLMTKFDVAENKLSGTRTSEVLLYHRQLSHLDISGNQFSGHADMTFPPSTLYVNISNNKFTSVGFKRFNPAYEALEVFDTSHNRINQDSSEVFLNIPPNIKTLILSDNAIGGTLPNPLTLQAVEHLAIANNNISGALPELSGSFHLIVLDLSNQKQGGLSGAISPRIAMLSDLEVLDLSSNNLSKAIPSSIGNLDQLKVLNLSSNFLSGSIPKVLGNLDALLEVLDLSTNLFTGLIPTALNNLQFASVYLTGNVNISSPAPLTQCTASNFDLMNDTRLCPPERSALKALYETSKGQEWTVDDLWLDEYESHCSWHGVDCFATNSTIELVLSSNGLSGTLSEKIGDLSLLEVLDLSNNDLKGSIPTEIGLLSQLTRLRLSHNSFKGNETNFGSLKHLEVIQLHSNRLSGTIPLLNLTFLDQSSFVADCGNPSDFEESLTCEECTMCCNNQDNCYPQIIETDVQKMGFENYMWFTGAFFLCLLIFSCVLAGFSFVYDKRRNQVLPRSSIRQPAFTNKDSKYALDTIGNDSVYQFFLGDSVVGWTIVLVTMALQIWMLFTFVEGSEIDLSDDKSDLVYTFKCPRDDIDCKDTSDLDWRGWIVFGVLMAAHLLKDIINGLKLTVLSAKERHSCRAKIRFFFGGWLLTTISTFTLYVSTIYNDAIATSNTEIIMNSVVILFIIDVDELFYEILMAINSSWVENICHEEEEGSVVAMGRHEEDVMEVNVLPKANHQSFQILAGEVEGLKKDVVILHKTLDKLQEQNVDLKRRLTMPQDLRP